MKSKMKSLRNESINGLSMLLILLISWIIYDSVTLYADAQVKGQVKGKQPVKGQSSFRESLNRLKQKQHQQEQEQALVSIKEIANEMRDEAAYADRKEQVKKQVKEAEVVQEEQEFQALSVVPRTSFNCQSVPQQPGMYADEEANCQAYHLCFDGGRHESFLCGMGTLFNQANLNCDHSHQVDCSKSAQFHHANTDFGRAVKFNGIGLSSSLSESAAAAKTKGAQQVAHVIPAKGSSITLGRSLVGHRQQKVNKTSLSEFSVSNKEGASKSKQQIQTEALGWEASEGQVGVRLEVATRLSKHNSTTSKGEKKSWWMNGKMSKGSLGVKDKQANEANATTFTDEWRPYFKSKGKQAPPTQKELNGQGKREEGGKLGTQMATTQSGQRSPTSSSTAATRETQTTSKESDNLEETSSSANSLTSSSVEYANETSSTSSLTTSSEELDSRGARRRRARQVSLDQLAGGDRSVANY